MLLRHLRWVGLGGMHALRWRSGILGDGPSWSQFYQVPEQVIILAPIWILVSSFVGLESGMACKIFHILMNWWRLLGKLC